jgi:hypothetical protein
MFTVLMKVWNNFQCKTMDDLSGREEDGIHKLLVSVFFKLVSIISPDQGYMA